MLIEKPEARDAFVRGTIKEHLDEVLLSVDETFTDISKEYIVVIG